MASELEKWARQGDQQANFCCMDDGVRLISRSRKKRLGNHQALAKVSGERYTGTIPLSYHGQIAKTDLMASTYVLVTTVTLR